MKTEHDKPRALTQSERGLTVALGSVMLFLSLVSLLATIALLSPLVRLVEGLSK